MTDPLLAPQPLTIERLTEKDDILVAQSTSMCCRCCCFQKSINWVMAELDNFTPGTDPYSLDITGWIHEESSFCGRTWSWILPGCRAAKYVQHHGPAPAEIVSENRDWFSCQKGPTTEGVLERDLQSNVVAIHEKNCTCGYCFNFGDLSFPICNCFPLPYLETKSSDGRVLGRTLYICDMCCFVPKYDVMDSTGQKKYRIRPDTCVCGLCVRCRCDGKKGKCCRVPFIIRDPNTYEHVSSGDKVNVVREGTATSTSAQIDNLWTGWANECCFRKDAYHLSFPRGTDVDDKLRLTGAAVLIDMTMFEQTDDS